MLTNAGLLIDDETYSCETAGFMNRNQTGGSFDDALPPS